MDVTPLVRKGTKIIQSYGAGRFKISGAVYDTPVIVTVDSVTPWSPRPVLMAEFSMEDFSALYPFSGLMDVILLGTGTKIEFLPPPLREGLRAKGILLEPMDTGAACRTYNVLITEGRRVASALLPTSANG